MNLSKNTCQSQYHRRSIRLKEYDYSQEGYYYVTLCTHNRQCIFGEIIEEQMQLNHLGQIAQQNWNKIPIYFPHIMLDEFIIMPNHVHGVLHLQKIQKKDSTLTQGISSTLGSVIRGFKSAVTQWARVNTNHEQLWQRNYYEHIIRNENSLFAIREYIAANPKNWLKDKLYSEENADRRNVE